MGHEPITKWIVLLVVSVQLAAAFALRNTSPYSPIFILVAYIIGGTANQNLFLAIHEITHNLAFKGIKANKFLAMFANLPIGIPYSVTFKVRIIHGCISRTHLFVEVSSGTSQTDGSRRRRHGSTDASRVAPTQQCCWKDILLVSWCIGFSA
jgi:hypothetical protein